MNDQLLHQLRVLKLPGIREHLEARILEAKSNDLAYEEFLSMLLSDELEQRTTRRINRLLKRASLGAETTVETFDFAFNNSISSKIIKSLASCRFIERAEGVFFIGPTGTGKTHLAKALAHAACRFMFSVGYYSFHQLFAELAAADLQNKLHFLMKRLLRVDLLVIDDFGFKTMDQASAERFYAIVDGRFRQRSIILTSNRAMADWPALFPDPIMANAILDRLAHTSHQIVIKGQSYRKKLQVKTDDASNQQAQTSESHQHARALSP
jgi:DNA replication protein DnaC